MKKEKKPGSQASVHSSGVGINDGEVLTLEMEMVVAA